MVTTSPPPSTALTTRQPVSQMKNSTSTTAGRAVSLLPSSGESNRATTLPPHTTIRPNNTQSPSVNGIPTRNNATGEVTDTASKIWENVKKILGFSPDCKNSGHKNLRGDCVCPKYFEGPLCESIICINNGTRLPSETCSCPHPQYISGRHCELLQCQNGGRDAGNGSCLCSDPNWYSGRYCEQYTSNWLAAVGLPLFVIATIIFCCVVCRLDLCPRGAAGRRRSRHRHQRYYEGPSPTDHHRQAARQSGGRLYDNLSGRQILPAREQQLISQNLLNDQLLQHLGVGGGHPHHPQQQQYVVRLEQIPTYNPHGLSMPATAAAEDAFKSLEPPPSYEQATSTTATPAPTAAVQPPGYSQPDSSDGGGGGSGGQQPNPNR